MSDTPVPAEKKVRRKRGPGYPSFNKQYTSLRDFQVQKRKELKNLQRAFEAVQCGVAYVPGYSKHWAKLAANLRAMIDSASPRSWK